MVLERGQLDGAEEQTHFTAHALRMRMDVGLADVSSEEFRALCLLLRSATRNRKRS